MYFSNTYYVRTKKTIGRMKIEKMIDDENSCNSSSDKTSFLLGQDRLSLYHLQKKHESLQQQQQQQQKREQKTRLQETEVTSSLMSLPQMNQGEVISYSSEVDYSRCSSSTSSTFHSDSCSITSSTLTPSSSLSFSLTNRYNDDTINGSFLSKKYKSDVNDKERQKQSQQLRKEHYQRVMSHKKMKHSKAIQSKVSSKLVNKRKFQGNEGSAMTRQPFLDDVSLGLLRFYRAATRATMSRTQKSTSDFDKSNNMNDDNNNILKEEKCEKKSANFKNEDDVLNEGDIFYSMSPEEFIPYFAQDLVSDLF